MSPKKKSEKTKQNKEKKYMEPVTVSELRKLIADRDADAEMWIHIETEEGMELKPLSAHVGWNAEEDIVLLTCEIPSHFGEKIKGEGYDIIGES